MFFFFGFLKSSGVTTLPLKPATFKPLYTPKAKKSFFLDATFLTGEPPGIIVFFPQLESVATSKETGRLSLRALGASSLRCGIV